MNSFVSLLDDTYITFQAAKHFATGHGLVFNVGEKYLSTSAPLYAILLGILGIPNPNAIPTIAIFLTAIAMLATACAFIKTGALLNRKSWGVPAGTIYLAIPMVWISVGFENTTQIALSAWAIYFYLKARQQERPAYACATLLALTAMIRPDGILAAGAVVIESVARVTYFSITRKTSLTKELKRETTILSAKAILLCLALLAVFYAGMALYFGSPLPGTMAAKVAQAQGGGMQTFAGGTIAWVQSLTQYYKPLNAIILFAAIGLITAVKNPAARIIFTYAALHTLAYQIVGIPFFAWYVIPECFALAALAGLGVEFIVGALSKQRRLRIPAISATALCLIALLFTSYRFAEFYYSPNPIHSKGVGISRVYMYPLVADWLKAHSNPSDRVGYYEVGEIGWLSDRKFVDPVGLITPNQETNIRTRQYDAAYREYNPEFVLCLQQKTASGWGTVYGLDPDKKDWFIDCYKQVDEIDNTPFRVAIFKKQLNYQDWRKSKLSQINQTRPPIARS